MGVYLYCVGEPDHPAPPAGLEGVAGAGVEAVEAAGLVAWVSRQERAPAASLEHVREHNAVVEAAATEQTPLPMRFGQWFGSEDELVDTLTERRPTLERSLDRVRGMVEFGVRVLDPARPEPATPDRSSGRAYLEGLARREADAEAARRRGAAVAVELAEFLGPVVRAQAVSPGGTEGLAAIAHLVARHETGTYARRLDTFTARRPDLRLVTSGPWPPYGFVDDGA